MEVVVGLRTVSVAAESFVVGFGCPSLRGGRGRLVVFCTPSLEGFVAYQSSSAGLCLALGKEVTAVIFW